MASSSKQVDLRVLMQQQQVDYAQIHQYLEIRLNEDFFTKPFTTELGAKIEGATPLEMAIERRDLTLVKLLLDYGAVVNAPERFEISASLNSELITQEIAALIKTRLVWRKHMQDHEIKYEKILYLIKGIPNYTNTTNRKGILVFGRTGFGKTTLVNYFLGQNYDIGRAPTTPRSMAIPRGEIIPNGGTIGQGINATTRVPMPHPYHPDINSVLIDMPGFEETRGKELEIASALSMERIKHNLSAIQCIVFVCSFAGLVEDVPPLGYYAGARHIGSYFEDMSNVNLLFVVTKTERNPENITNGDIIRRIREIHQGLDLQTAGEREIRAVTSKILNSHQCVHIADIRTDDSRKYLFGTIAAFENPTPVESFNSTNDTAVQQFKTALKHSIGEKLNKLMGDVEGAKAEYSKYSTIQNLIRQVNISGSDYFNLNFVTTQPKITHEHQGSYIITTPVLRSPLSAMINKRTNFTYVKHVPKSGSAQLEAVTIDENGRENFNFLLDEHSNKFNVTTEPYQLTLTLKEIRELMANTNHTPERAVVCLQKYIQSIMDNDPLHLVRDWILPLILIDLVIMALEFWLAKTVGRIEILAFVGLIVAYFCTNSLARRFAPLHSALKELKAKIENITSAIEDQDPNINNLITEVKTKMKEISEPLDISIKEYHLELSVNTEYYEELKHILEGFYLVAGDYDLALFIEQVNRLNVLLPELIALLTPSTRSNAPSNLDVRMQDVAESSSRRTTPSPSQAPHEETQTFFSCRKRKRPDSTSCWDRMTRFCPGFFKTTTKMPVSSLQRSSGNCSQPH